MDHMIIAGIVIFIIYILMLLPGRMPKAVDDQLWTSFYAHRGLHEKDRSIPENSMVAFKKAVEAGYGIEMDLNLTADGKIIVFHDDNLSRLCGVDKLLTDCTYNELTGYMLENTEEKIPLFEDVLKMVKGQVPLIVELKNTKNINGLCSKTSELLDDYEGLYCVESFNPFIVRWFYKNRPDVVRGQISVGRKSLKNFDVKLWQWLLIISFGTNLVTRPHFMAFCHGDARRKLGLCLFHLLAGRLVGWTVQDTDDFEYCMKRFDVIIFEYFQPEVK